MTKLSLKEAKEKLKKVSNFAEVKRRAKRLFGPRAMVSVNQDGKHKYSFSLPTKGIHHRSFGDIHYEDFTKHKDKKRRANYLSRSRNIRGNWKKDKYSKNNLAIRLLW